MNLFLTRALALALCVAAGCADPGSSGPSSGAADAGPGGGLDGVAEVGSSLPAGWVQLPKEPQRSGDPDYGYQVILEGTYTGCGIPTKAYEVAAGMGVAPFGEPAPGGAEDLPWFLSRFETYTGVDVVGPNCLTCHAGLINGELVVGLGSTNLSFTDAAGALGQMDASMVDLVAGVAALDPAETAEFARFVERFKTIAPYVEVDTQGVNPADNLAAILFAHRDPETLAWSTTPLLEPPPVDVVPVDVPPWWRMAKKHAMFYVGGGRGDHARIMMTSSTLCVDEVEEAAAIDAEFGHVRAFIRSIEPPAWPWDVDEALAEEGRAVFEVHCATCHGTYGDEPTYPNLVIPASEVGTDPSLALGASQFAGRFIDWFEASFYGETADLLPHEGYVPPPLDGIWATAPFLHNGSVPTLATLLDSSTRPTYWRRSFDSNDYDVDAVGWNFMILAYGKEGEVNDSLRKQLYDTTRFGYGNGGHLYGDGLSSPERLALLEYLKTL